MLYPVFTCDDGTEITMSKPDKEGQILLYIEKFDIEKDEFIDATVCLNDMIVKSIHRMVILLIIEFAKR